MGTPIRIRPASALTHAARCAPSSRASLARVSSAAAPRGFCPGHATLLGLSAPSYPLCVGRVTVLSMKLFCGLTQLGVVLSPLHDWEADTGADGHTHTHTHTHTRSPATWRVHVAPQRAGTGAANIPTLLCVPHPGHLFWILLS